MQHLPFSFLNYKQMGMCSFAVAAPTEWKSSLAPSVLRIVSLDLDDICILMYLDKPILHQPYQLLMGVFHWGQPYNRLYFSRVGLQSQGSGTKMQQKGHKTIWVGYTFPTRRSTFQTCLEQDTDLTKDQGVFSMTREETIRTSRKPVTDKPYQFTTSCNDNPTRLESVSPSNPTWLIIFWSREQINTIETCSGCCNSSLSLQR